MMIPRLCGSEPKACSVKWEWIADNLGYFEMLAYLSNVTRLREQREGKGMISRREI